MTKLTYSSKNTPCPVCDRTKDEDCRISQNGELVMCHSTVDNRVKGETVNGFVYVGPTENKLWDKFILSSALRKSLEYRPVGRKYQFPYTDKNGSVLCRKTRIYQSQPDGQVKKKTVGLQLGCVAIN